MDIIKPTREQLSQVYYINREIRNLRWILESSRVGVKGQQITGMPHSITNRPTDPTASEGIKAAEINYKIEQLEKKANEEKAKILSYVLEMEDSRMRQIVVLRCIELLPWEKVAELIGGNNTAATCKVAFYREFK